MDNEARITHLETKIAAISGSLYALKSAMVLALSGEASSTLLEHRKERLLSEAILSNAPEQMLVAMRDDFEILIDALKAGGK